MNLTPQQRERIDKRDRLIRMDFDILGIRQKVLADKYHLSVSSIKRIVYKKRGNMA